METSLKTGFAQVFSCYPKNLSCPNFGGAAAPLGPPARTPMFELHSRWVPLSELPRTNPASGQGETWTQAFQIASPAP